MTRVKVYDQRCQTCVFWPGNRMHLNPGRLADLVKHNRAASAALECHTSTHGRMPQTVLCRGYLDAYGDETTSVQVYQRMGGEFETVTPAGCDPAGGTPYPAVGAAQQPQHE